MSGVCHLLAVFSPASLASNRLEPCTLVRSLHQVASGELQSMLAGQGEPQVYAWLRLKWTSLDKPVCCALRHQQFCDTARRGVLGINRQDFIADVELCNQAKQFGHVTKGQWMNSPFIAT